MGLDRPIKLSLIFAFASVSIAAIRLVAHLPYVVNTWHCFQLVPSASVLRPVLVQQICHVLLLCRRTPWQSETCADQLEDISDFQPISTNLSRKISRWSRQSDQQSESQCAYLMLHLRCSAPSESSSSLNVIFQKFTSMDTMSIEGLCMIHCHFFF